MEGIIDPAYRKRQAQQQVQAQPFRQGKNTTFRGDGATVGGVFTRQY